MEYRTTKQYNNIFVVQNQDYEWEVINIDGIVIVPFWQVWMDRYF